jgi:hypothetical protein
MPYIDQAVSKLWKLCCDIAALDRYSCDITQKGMSILTIETGGCDVTRVIFSQRKIIIIICCFNSSSSSSSIINTIINVVLVVFVVILVLCAGSSVGVVMTY